MTRTTRPSAPTPAPVGTRVAACLVDGFIGVAAIGVAGSFVAAVVTGVLQMFGMPARPATLSAAVLAVLVAGVGWLVLLTTLQVGQGTVGQRIMGLRVVDRSTGGPLRFGQALTRRLVWTGTAVVVVGFFSPLFDDSPARLGWHDKAVGSMTASRVAAPVPVSEGTDAVAPTRRRRAAVDEPPALTEGLSLFADAVVGEGEPWAEPMPWADRMPWRRPSRADAAPTEPAAGPRRRGAPAAMPAAPVSPPPAPRPVPGPVPTLFDEILAPTSAPTPAEPSVPSSPVASPSAPSPSVLPEPSPDRSVASLFPDAPAAPAASVAATPLFGAAPAQPSAAPPDVDDAPLFAGATVGQETVALPQQPAAAAPRRPLAVFEWDDGTRSSVYGPTVFGRDPVHTAGVAVVPVRDETLSLSKTHFEVGGGATGLWVVDRNSTNGVALVRAGVRAVLAPGLRTGLRVGDRLELGDRSVTVREE